MNKSSAVQLLESTFAHDRLLAARFLSRDPSFDDIEIIERALRKENVSWVRNALSVALRRIKGEDVSTTSDVLGNDKGQLTVSDYQAREIYGNALKESTSILLHEIEPLVGKARLYAKREIKDFENSKVKIQLDVLGSLLESISELRMASVPATLNEIELSSVIREAKELVTGEHSIDIQLAGPDPFPVIADRGRLWLAITNGLRNAVESTELVDEQVRRPVVINWNRTEKDYWISIIDQGVGMKASSVKAFEIGTSSKRDHLGMGLPIAREAILSLQGEVAITPRSHGGVKFEIRWPTFFASPT